MIQLNVFVAISYENAHGRVGRISEIIDYSGLSRSTVQRHLASLVDYGLIVKRKRGEYVIEDSWAVTQISRARDALKRGQVQ